MTMPDWKNRVSDTVTLVPANQLLAHPENARRHPARQREALRGSLDAIGWAAPILISKYSQHVLDGHARIEEALTRDENALIPVVEVELSEDEERLFLASYDWITGLAEYDRDALDSLLQEVQTDSAALQSMLSEQATSFGLYFGDSDTVIPDSTVQHSTLADRFLIPPFSVLDARQGYWQARKRLWLDMGIQSELGRGADIVPNGTQRPPEHDGAYFRSNTRRIQGKLTAAIGGQPLPLDRMKNGRSLARTFGQDLMRGEHTVGPRMMLDNAAPDTSNPTSIHNIPGYYWKRERGMSDKEIFAAYISASPVANVSGTSIFDPVLCELAYTWFTPSGAHVLDPFAGGSVRGIVASKLGRQYIGVDLSAEQIAANVEQGQVITPDNVPAWITGDSAFIDTLAPGQYDFIFTCPPYADLEIYSDDERDISNMPYDQFLTAYRTIIAKSCAMLSDNRFACIVVGDVRDKRGNYRNFVADTIQAFLDAGLHLYNEAILVTSVGSLPIRVGKQFESGRKLGKTHQNVLVFLKGDSKKAAAYCGHVDIYIPAEQLEDGN